MRVTGNYYGDYRPLTPPDPTWCECERCGGTGKIHYIARSDGDGDVIQSTFKEVDEATYTACPYNAPAGTWVRCEDEPCPDCNGEGWIEDDDDWARCERADAEREERLLREAGYDD